MAEYQQPAHLAQLAEIPQQRGAAGLCWKMQPNRCIALRGFDDRGAAAALHSATASSFKVSGVFRDSADFCVLNIWDADDFYRHPRIKYLPSFDFAGVVLEFEVTYTGLMPLDSSLFPSIDWPYMDVIREDGSTARIRLVPAGGPASTWYVRIDFAALGIGRIRKAWLTFAPPIPPGAAYTGGEWEADFTYWVLSGAAAQTYVAGAGSVRVDSSDSWCGYAGTWNTEAGFYHRGFARGTPSGGSVTARWHCASTHDLYVGTSLYLDRGVIGVSVDGGAETDLDCYLSSDAQVNARRLVRTSVAPGEHSVTLRHKSGGPIYFDYLDAIIPSETVQPPEAIYTDRAPAMDYGTDHTYKLSPAKVMWMMDALGYHGSMNVYVSVFWWNQRRVEGRVLPFVAVQIPAAAVVPGYNVFVKVGASVWGRFIIGGDTAATVAAAIAASLNADAVGVWASAAGDILTITNRAATPIYSFPFEAWYETPARVEISYTGALTGGSPGTWVIDGPVNPTLNRGAREWLADLSRECAARGRELVLAYSMELLNPPDSWAARYPDGSPVVTATGFATNFTTHCAFMTGILDYQKRVYLETAAIMNAAGLTPKMQFGEFTWWFFPEHGGMAYYDATTRAAALGALGRDLHSFAAPDSDPHVNGSADANFLRGRLVDHCAGIRSHVRAAYPAAKFEILLPLDVNYPEPYSAISPLSGLSYSLGGRLNYYVNVPDEFRNPATAPFDLIKIEGLDFGSGSRNATRALRAIRWPYTEASWTKDRCRYLVPVFNGGCPWTHEMKLALGEQIPVVNFWAHDHVHLFGWLMSEAEPRETAQEVSG